MSEPTVDTPTEPAKATRHRAKGGTKALRDLIKEIDTLSQNAELKPSKLADLALEKSSLVRALIGLEAEELESEQTVRIDALEVAHTADVARISELTKDNGRLEILSQTKEVVTVSDPRHAEVKEMKDSLEHIIVVLTEEMSEEARIELAVRVASKCSPQATEYFCRITRVDKVLQFLRRMLQSSEEDLTRLRVAKGSDGAVIRAILKVKYSKFFEPPVQSVPEHIFLTPPPRRQEDRRVAPETPQTPQTPSLYAVALPVLEPSDVERAAIELQRKRSEENVRSTNDKVEAERQAVRVHDEPDKPEDLDEDDWGERYEASLAELTRLRALKAALVSESALEQQ